MTKWSGLVVALVASLVTVPSALAQQPGWMTLKKAEDEELILYPWSLSVDDIEDMSVQGVDGTPFGEVEDALVDHTGAIRALVINYGRVLGPPDRQAIVPIEKLTPKDRENLILDMTAQDLQALPDWND